MLYNNEHCYGRVFPPPECSFLTTNDVLECSIFFTVMISWGSGRKLRSNGTRCRKYFRERERATRAFSTLAHGSKFGIPTSAQEALRHKNPSHTACWADSSDFRASSGMKRCKLQVVNSEKQEKQKRAHTSWSQDLTYFHTPKFLDELSEINAYLGKNVIHRADWDSHRLHCLSPAPEQDTQSLGTS